MRILKLAVAGLLVALMLAPAAADARSARHPGAAKADRNHDRIPDRWERRHRLSLRVKQTARDPDRDGLANLGEYRAGTNPRDRDTDDDGLRDGAELRVKLNPRRRDSDGDGVGDGDENAGRIVSFEDGVLTVGLAGGGSVSGKVTDATDIVCKTSAAPETRARVALGTGAPKARIATGDTGGVDEPEDEDELPAPEDGEDEGGHCSAAALVPGTVVREASLKLTDGVAVFREVALLK